MHYKVIGMTSGLANYNYKPEVDILLICSSESDSNLVKDLWEFDLEEGDSRNMNYPEGQTVDSALEYYRENEFIVWEFGYDP